MSLATPTEVVDDVEHEHVPVIGPPAHSDKWYALRTLDRSRTKRPVIIGASEAATVCGMNPYSTPLHLYLEKRGELETDFTTEQLERMDFGKRLEPIILDAYEQRAEVTVTRDCPLYFHPDHPWMACTPDGIATTADGDEWGIECKCTSWRMYDAHGVSIDAFGEDGTDQVPTVYLLQAQWQMAVMGWDRVDLPVLFDGSKLRTYTVGRDDGIIRDLIGSGELMVRRILDSDPPEPIWAHDGTRGALEALYGVDTRDAVELTDEHDELWWSYQELGQQKKEIESRRSEIYNRLIGALQGSCSGLLPNGQKLKRSVCDETYVTEKDVAEMVAKIGQVKRKGYTRLTGPRKRKES